MPAAPAHAMYASLSKQHQTLRSTLQSYQATEWHLVVQGPSHLLPAPPSDVVVEDVTNAQDKDKVTSVKC